MGVVKFVRDVGSPELGTYVDSIRIAPLDAKDPHGPGELLRCEDACKWGLRRMVEPGSISGYPGIRAMRLWYAGVEAASLDADDDEDMLVDEVQDMSLDDTIESNKGRQPVILLASSRWTGGLAVSSCLGQEYPTPDVRIPVPNRLETRDPVVQVIMQDFGRVEDLGELAWQHIGRTENERLNLAVAPANPSQLDVQLVHLLRVLPEHSLAKSLAAPSAVLLAA